MATAPERDAWGGDEVWLPHTAPRSGYDGVTIDERLLIPPRCTGARAGCRPGRGGGPSPCRCICSWSSDVLRGRTVARLRFECPVPDYGRRLFLFGFVVLKLGLLSG